MELTERRQRAPVKNTNTNLYPLRRNSHENKQKNPENDL